MSSGKNIDEYTLINELGHGNFGYVYYTKNNKDNTYCATKVIPKSNPYLDFLRREISVLKTISHKNIVKLICEKETSNNIYIMIEYVNGGEIANALEDYKNMYKKPFPEEYVVEIIRQLSDALYYLNNKKIIHRDIKLENILINYNSEEDKQNMNILNSQIKLIDFGFAKHLNENSMTHSICGTAATTDPRIVDAMKNKTSVKGGYDNKVDIWSLGIILYNLLVGELPFQGENLDCLAKKIELGNYFIPETINLSVESICLINGLLQSDPYKRLSWKEILSHPFLTSDPKKFNRIDLSNNNKSKDMIISIKNKDLIDKLWGMFDNKNKIDLSMIKKPNDELISKIFPSVPKHDKKPSGFSGGEEESTSLEKFPSIPNKQLWDNNNIPTESELNNKINEKEDYVYVIKVVY